MVAVQGVTTFDLHQRKDVTMKVCDLLCDYDLSVHLISCLHVYLICLFTASPVSMETVHVDPDTSPQDSIVGPPQDDDRVSPC